MELVATPTNEWGPALQKVREADPAAIVNTHFIAPEIAACQNQFMQNPTNSLMYYQYGPILRAFTDIAQKNAEGVMASILLATLRDERGSRTMPSTGPCSGTIPRRRRACRPMA